MDKKLFYKYFWQPRSHINKPHSLVDILLIGIISVIFGAETWKQMIEFTNSKGGIS